MVVLLAASLAGATVAVAASPPAPRIMVVPDLRHQAYVFAKGTLMDAGFAWTLEGATQGYPSNLVVAQVPAPGTRLVDTGAPTIRLTLGKNPRSPELGNPERASSYLGTPAVTPAEAAAAAKRLARAAKISAAREAAKAARAARAAAAKDAAAAARAAKAAAAKKAATATRAAKVAAAAKASAAAVARAKGSTPAKATPATATPAKAAPGKATPSGATPAKATAAKAKVAAPVEARAPAPAQATAPRQSSAPVASASPAKPAPRAASPRPRPVSFPVAGAPIEPVKELPLPQRARLLARWIATRPALTPANRHHYLYQQAWVVTGARFGWWRGEEALRILVVADREIERLWQLAPVVRQEAEAALAEVHQRTAAAAARAVKR